MMSMMDEKPPYSDPALVEYTNVAVMEDPLVIDKPDQHDGQATGDADAAVYNEDPMNATGALAHLPHVFRLGRRVLVGGGPKRQGDQPPEGAGDPKKPKQEGKIDETYWYHDDDLYYALLAELHDLVNIKNVFVLPPVASFELGLDEDPLKWLEDDGIREAVKWYDDTKVVIPYNIGGFHWTGLVVHVNRQGTVTKAVWLDSTNPRHDGAYEPAAPEEAVHLCKAVCQFFSSPSVTPSWPGVAPLQQKNGHDCGPCTCANIVNYIKGDMGRAEKDVPKLRRHQLEQLPETVKRSSQVRQQLWSQGKRWTTATKRGSGEISAAVAEQFDYFLRRQAKKEVTWENFQEYVGMFEFKQGPTETQWNNIMRATFPGVNLQDPNAVKQALQERELDSKIAFQHRQVRWPREDTEISDVVKYVLVHHCQEELDSEDCEGYTTMFLKQKYKKWGQWKKDFEQDKNEWVVEAKSWGLAAGFYKNLYALLKQDQGPRIADESQQSWWVHSSISGHDLLYEMPDRPLAMTPQRLMEREACEPLVYSDLINLLMKGRPNSLGSDRIGVKEFFQANSHRQRHYVLINAASFMGKSIALLYCVDYLIRERVVVIYIPQGDTWLGYRRDERQCVTFFFKAVAHSTREMLDQHAPTGTTWRALIEAGLAAPTYLNADAFLCAFEKYEGTKAIVIDRFHSVQADEGALTDMYAGFATLFRPEPMLDAKGRLAHVLCTSRRALEVAEAQTQHGYIKIEHVSRWDEAIVQQLINYHNLSDLHPRHVLTATEGIPNLVVMYLRFYKRTHGDPKLRRRETQADFERVIIEMYHTKLSLALQSDARGLLPEQLVTWWVNTRSRQPRVALPSYFPPNLLLGNQFQSRYIKDLLLEWVRDNYEERLTRSLGQTELTMEMMRTWLLGSTADAAKRSVVGWLWQEHSERKFSLPGSRYTLSIYDYQGHREILVLRIDESKQVADGLPSRVKFNVLYLLNGDFPVMDGFIVLETVVVILQQAAGLRPLKGKGQDERRMRNEGWLEEICSRCRPPLNVEEVALKYLIVSPFPSTLKGLCIGRLRQARKERFVLAAEELVRNGLMDAELSCRFRQFAQDEGKLHARISCNNPRDPEEEEDEQSDDAESGDDGPPVALQTVVPCVMCRKEIGAGAHRKQCSECHGWLHGAYSRPCWKRHQYRCN